MKLKRGYSDCSSNQLSEDEKLAARWYQRRYERRLTELMKCGARLSRLPNLAIHVGVDFGSSKPTIGPIIYATRGG